MFILMQIRWRRAEAGSRDVGAAEYLGVGAYSEFCSHGSVFGPWYVIHVISYGVWDISTYNGIPWKAMSALVEVDGRW